MKTLLATTFLMTAALAFAGSASAYAIFTTGPGHQCGGDVDHECYKCPSGTTYENGVCKDNNGVTQPPEICAVYWLGTCD